MEINIIIAGYIYYLQSFSIKVIDSTLKRRICRIIWLEERREKKKCKKYAIQMM